MDAILEGAISLHERAVQYASNYQQAEENLSELTKITAQNLQPLLINSRFIIFGGALLASGIYNLAKKIKD